MKLRAQLDSNPKLLIYTNGLRMVGYKHYKTIGGKQAMSPTRDTFELVGPPWAVGNPLSPWEEVFLKTGEASSVVTLPERQYRLEVL